MQIFATAFAILLLLYNTLKAPIKYFIICSAFRRSTGIMLFWGVFFSFVCCFFLFLLFCSAPYLDWPMRYLNDSFLRFPLPRLFFKVQYSLLMNAETAQRRHSVIPPPPKKKKESDSDFQLFYSEKKVSL